MKLLWNLCSKTSEVWGDTFVEQLQTWGKTQRICLTRGGHMAALLPFGSRSSDCSIEALERFCGHLQGLKVSLGCIRAHLGLGLSCVSCQKGTGACNPSRRTCPGHNSSMKQVEQLANTWEISSKLWGGNLQTFCFTKELLRFIPHLL